MRRSNRNPAAQHAAARRVARTRRSRARKEAAARIVVVVRLIVEAGAAVHLAAATGSPVVIGVAVIREIGAIWRKLDRISRTKAWKEAANELGWQISVRDRRANSSMSALARRRAREEKPDLPITPATINAWARGELPPGLVTA